MLEQLNLSQDIQPVLTKLDSLPASINTINKEQSRAIVKDAQLVINAAADVLNKLSAEEMALINNELAIRNYRLIKNQSGGWDLIDRYIAYEDKGNYSAMFKVFTESSNDKESGIKALNQFMQDLLVHLKNIPDFSGEKDIELLDLGCGDGQVGASLMNVLAQNAKIKYTAVDRDSKYSAQVKQNCDKYGIDHIFHGQDFRHMQEALVNEKGTFVLASHLYTSTPMNQFITQVFKMMGDNGILILIHNKDPESDPGQIRTKHADFLKSIIQDHPKLIANTFNDMDLQATLTLGYESDITFPKLSEADWEQLKNIKQAAYDADYSGFSEDLIKAKRLIEFAVSDRLEAFTELERITVLNSIKLVLTQKNYTLKNKCAIQVALSPNACLELKKQFMELKPVIEKIPAKADVQAGATASTSTSTLFYHASSKAKVTPAKVDQNAFGF